MIKIDDKVKCSGCYACYSCCQEQCISMEKDDEGFSYPVLDNTKCIDCGLCDIVCPFMEFNKSSTLNSAFAAKCLDDKLRYESSSGGIFSLLAIKNINDGGLVFGAAFSDDYRIVQHISIDNYNDLNKLRTSKYLQSEIGETYKEAKQLLVDGEKVLFSGVPCQIAGLKKYLNKEYDNLLCVDVICHGVPSPYLWKNYITNIEKNFDEKIKGINFRHKKNGWQDFGINRILGEESVYSSKNEDPYMQMFLRNYSLRPSCYECHIKNTASYADITLGDFWGIDQVLPQMDDGKGVSAVIVHTIKGKRAFDSILNDVEAVEVPYDDIKKYNIAICQSVNRPAERNVFFQDMAIMEFDKLAAKYCKPLKKSLKQRLGSSKIGIIFRRIISRSA